MRQRFQGLSAPAGASPPRTKVAYSLNGEGLGHAGRAATLIPPLAADYDITVFAPDSLDRYLQDKLPTLPRRPITAFLLEKKGDRIRYLSTILANFLNILQAPGEILRLARALKAESFQAVISDFEPLLTWAGRLAGLPVLQLNHPGVLLRQKFMGFEGIAARFVAKLMEGPWTQRLHISFFGGDAGPLVRDSFFAHPQTRGQHFTVYLREGYAATILPVLEKIKEELPGLIWELFPDPLRNYEQSLAGCRALITSAGHQALSEALVLKKPVLALPQTGQAEQQVNARMLEASGRGMAGQLVSFERDFRKFLDRLPDLEKAAGLPAPPSFRLENSLPQVLARLRNFLERSAQPSKV